MSIVGDAFARPVVAALEAAEDAGRPYDLSSLQRVVSTGATLSAASKRALAARQPMAIIDMIGASEGGPYAINMTMPGQDPGETAVFTVTPQTVLFDDLTWEPIPPGAGRSGVLAVAGAMPRGYYKDPDEDRGDVPGDRREALHGARRLRHGRRRRDGPPPGPRVGVHQHRRREGLPGGGRGGRAPTRAWPTATPSVCRTTATARP